MAHVINLLPPKLTPPIPPGPTPLEYLDANDYIATELIVPAINATFQYIIIYNYEYGSDMELIDDANGLKICVDASDANKYGITYNGVFYKATIGSKQIFRLPQPITVSAGATVGYRLNGRCVLAADAIDINQITYESAAGCPGTPVSAAGGQSVQYIYIKNHSQSYSDVVLNNPWGLNSPYNVIIQPYYEINKFWFGNLQLTTSNGLLITLPKPWKIPNLDWTGCSAEVQPYANDAMDFGV